MRVHHLNNVNKALQILEQNNVSVKFQLKTIGFLSAQQYIYISLYYIKIRTFFELYSSCLGDLYF